MCVLCDIKNEVPNNIFTDFVRTIDEISKLIFDRKKMKFSLDMFQLTYNYLQSGLINAKTPETGVDFYNSDHLRKKLLELNLFRFSASKTSAMVYEMNKLSKASETFSEFKKQVDQLNINYNKHYLNVEYNDTHSISQNGSKYISQEQEKDIFPFLKYETIGDARVRDSHKKLNGKVFKIGDPALDVIYPPNSNNCRCIMIQLEEDEVDTRDLATKDEVINILKDTPRTKSKSEWDYMKKGNWNKNFGKLNHVFSNNRMYIKNFNDESLSYRDFNQKPYKDMNIDRTYSTGSNAKEWFEAKQNDDGIVELLSYDNSKVKLSKQKFMNTSKYQHLENIIFNPDEVFSTKNRTQYRKRYIKFFKGKSLFIDTKLGSNLDEEIVSIKSSENIDSKRKGILIRK